MTKLAKVEQEPVHYELAEWFLSGGENVRSPDDILEKIYKVRERRGVKSDVIRKEYKGYITDCRIYLEEKYKVTLWPVRLGDFRFCGYKIASDQEATVMVVKTGKQVMMAMERFRRRLPMTKKEYLWPSVKQVFGDTKEAALRYKALGDRFIAAYDEDDKRLKLEHRKEQKQIELQDTNKELTHGKQRMAKSA